MAQTDRSLSRREFARRAALGAASASLLPLAALASSSPAEPGKPMRQSTLPAPAGPPKLSPQSQAEADSRYQTILNQYGDRFSEAQKTDLKRLCAFIQPPLDRIRAYAILNGDLPALYLKPLVDRDKKPSATSGGKSSTARPGATTTPAKKP